MVQKWPFFELSFLCNIGQENVFYDIVERKNNILGYKNKKFKKSKNWRFSKRVYPWFCLKHGHFSNFFFRQCKPGICLLRYSRTKKRPFSAIKTKSSKSQKIDGFTKGFTHGFVQNMAIFFNFFFRHYMPGKCLLRYSRMKKCLSRLNKEEV